MTTCDEPPVWLMETPTGSRIRVCWRCRDELRAVFDCRLLIDE